MTQTGRWNLWMRWAGFVPAAFLTASLTVAQQLPPAEEPLPMPGSNAPVTTITVRSHEVLVPTLVEKRGGDVVYGLRAKDFIVEDNGVRQKLHVQEELDSAPVALVVAVEQGRASGLEFDKFAKLSPLLDSFLADHRSQVALVGFDSMPHLLHDFTHSSDDLTQILKQPDQGDGGDAILDTISYATDLLQGTPKEYRRVLLLIGEQRDHGSKHTKEAELIAKIGQTDVLVLSVAFSPAKAEFAHDLRDNGDNRTLNMINTLWMLVQAFKKNVSKEVARMSGGEYLTFGSDKSFEQHVLDAAKHTRNRYLITFSPTDSTPGLHTLKVTTVEDYGARIVARAHYWRAEDQ